jgi:hypothetical protein
MNFDNLEFHELSNEFPLLTEAELQELAQDIKYDQRGLPQDVSKKMAAKG